MREQAVPRDHVRQETAAQRVNKFMMHPGLAEIREKGKVKRQRKARGGAFGYCPRIAAFRPLRDGDRRKPLDGARGGLLGSSLVLEPTDDEAA